MRRHLQCAMAAIAMTHPTPSPAFGLQAGRITSSPHGLSISYNESRGNSGKASENESSSSSSSPSLASASATSSLAQSASAPLSTPLSTPPTTLFIHGLDSSSHTWRGVQSSLSTPSIAIDCRGCGRSDLGDPNLFSADALVEDIKCLVNSHPLLHGMKDEGSMERRNDRASRNDKKFVLVGHSMGGRIAMSYAAKYPEDISALVIEDMDIQRRGTDTNMIQNFNEKKAIEFERGGDSLESLVQNLMDIGYPMEMMDKWIAEKRMCSVENDEAIPYKYWCEANPAFRALCYREIFDSDIGTECWNTIVENCKRMSAENWKENRHAKIYLMVAGIGTVCKEESIDAMRMSMSNNERVKNLLSIKTYPEGTHSIHNSAREEFMLDLEKIIESSRNPIIASSL